MKGHKIAKYTSIVLIIIILAIGFVLIKSTSPQRAAKKQAVKIAKDIGNIKQVDEFYWFTRDQSFFTIVGKDDKNQGKIVIIPEDGKEGIVYDTKDGVHYGEAVQAVLDSNETTYIKNINLGMVDNKPVWEISADGKNHELNYYLVDFKTGKIIEKIIGV